MTAHNPQLDKERLLQLSSEVSRIATTLARLSSESEMFTPDEKSRDTGPLPEISPKAVAALMRMRRVRATYFDQELFADPAWDMMLELFHAELTHRRVPVSNLCSAAAVPATHGPALAENAGREGTCRSTRRSARRSPGLCRAAAADE